MTDINRIINYKHTYTDILNIIGSLNPDINRDDIKKIVFHFMDTDTCFNNIYKTRYFNNITDLNNGYLKKEALDKKGLLLIKNEKNYYKIISFTSINNLFPKIIEYTPNYFIMEKLIGIPLYMCDNYDIYLELVFKSLESLHNYNYKIIDENEFDMNLKIEFYEKIIQRLNNIIPIINYLDISSINGINIKYNNSIKKII